MRAHLPQDLRRLPRLYIQSGQPGQPGQTAQTDQTDQTTQVDQPDCELRPGDIVSPEQLPPGEHKHLKARHRDRVLLMNGLGGLWSAQVGRDFSLHVQEHISIAAPAPRHLFAALPAREGLFELLRMATMGGATHIHFFISQHSLSHANKVSPNDIQRAGRIVRATAKQALVFHLPQLVWPQKNTDLRAILDAYTPLCLLDPGGVSSGIPADTWPVIGPEGGWSEQEIQLTEAYAVTSVSLQTPVLTAAAAALAVLVMMPKGTP